MARLERIGNDAEQPRQVRERRQSSTRKAGLPNYREASDSESEMSEPEPRKSSKRSPALVSRPAISKCEPNGSKIRPEQKASAGKTIGLKCRFCPKVFSYAGYLDRHEKTHQTCLSTKTGLHSISKDDRAEGKKEVTCQACGKRLVLRPRRATSANAGNGKTSEANGEMSAIGGTSL